MAATAVVPVFLFLGGALLLGYAARLVHARWRVSDVTTLIAAGVVVGPVLGLVPHVAARETLLALAPFGLAVVLFQGGLELAWRDVRAHGARGLKVSAAAWLAGAAAATLTAHLALGLAWDAAVLLGAALAATGILVVIPLLESVRAPPAARVTLTMETALGDLVSAVAVTALTAALLAGGGWNVAIGLFAAKLALGGATGLVLGLAWARALHDLARERHAYQLTLAALLLTFAVAEALGGSGFLAALVMGVVVGNAGALSLAGVPRVAPLPADAHAQQSGLILVLKSVYFPLLGASVPASAFTGGLVGGALVLGVVVLVARAVAVLLALTPRHAHDPPGHRVLLATCAPRGIATAALATVPLAAGVPGTEAFPAVTFIVILVADAVTGAGVLAYERVRGRSRETAAPAATLEETVRA